MLRFAIGVPTVGTVRPPRARGPPPLTRSNHVEPARSACPSWPHPSRSTEAGRRLCAGGPLGQPDLRVGPAADVERRAACDRAGAFARRIGLAAEGGAIAFRHGPLELAFADRDHPIVRNFTRLALHDESYWRLTGDTAGITVLATSTEEGVPTPQLWVKEEGAGRVFVSIPGHYSWTFDDPLFRILLLRGIAWAAREPVDRFNDLVTPGARLGR